MYPSIEASTAKCREDGRNGEVLEKSALASLSSFLEL